LCAFHYLQFDFCKVDVWLHSTALERLVAGDPRTTPQDASDSDRPTVPYEANATDSPQSEFEFELTPADSALVDAPNSPQSQHAAQQSPAIPPVFVGDEEIVSWAVHRPRAIPGDIFQN
jgi:hypothetical protein